MAKKSAQKRIRQTKKITVLNKRRKRAFKKAIKNLLQVTSQPGKEKDVQISLSKAPSLLDKAAQKGTIPKERASRKKSQLAQKVNEYLAGDSEKK